MTLNQLNYVITIAEQGSINKAAQQLYISQPSLTTTAVYFPALSDQCSTGTGERAGDRTVPPERQRGDPDQ